MNDVLDRMTKKMETGLKEHIFETNELPEGPKPTASDSTLHNPFKDELLGDDDDGSSK